MAVKILALLSLVFYFFALVFGLMLWFGGDQRDLMTHSEVYGYSTIMKPEKAKEWAEEIKKLMNEENKLMERVDQLESDIVDRQTRMLDLEAEIAQLQSEYDLLSRENQQYKRGQLLAANLLSMKSDAAVKTLEGLSQEDLAFFVSYALPTMSADKTKERAYKKFMTLLGKSKIGQKVQELTIDNGRGRNQ